MHDAEHLIHEVLAAGARAFVLKSEGGRKLIEAIHAVLRQKPSIDARASESLLNSFLKSHSDAEGTCPLTVRECEVVQLLSIGKTNKEAAHVLGISVKTVETHRATIMRKMGFSSIAELVRYAVRENLIKA
jgi:DNA-binding NarL/FixJ family response regulator